MPTGSHPSGLGGESGFAPEDLTDGRRPGEWQSRYEPEAWKFIRREAAYLVVFMVMALVMILLVWLRRPQSLLHLSAADTRVFSRYAFAGLSGALGGVLFAMKWLYHTVAKQEWHLDRRPWRYLTPLISGGLAFFTVAIVQSVSAFDPAVVSTNARTTAFGFLIGFFSDNALAKLAEIAETLLGRTRHATSRKASSHPPSPRAD
jgi:hypothetical protein